MVWDSSLVLRRDQLSVMLIWSGYVYSTNGAKTLSPQIWRPKCMLWVSGWWESDWNTDNLLLLINQRSTNISQKLWADDAVCMCSVGECLIRVNVMNLLAACTLCVHFNSPLGPIGVGQHTEEPLDWRGINGQSMQERKQAWEDPLSDDGITVPNLILS